LYKYRYKSNTRKTGVVIGKNYFLFYFIVTIRHWQNLRAFNSPCLALSKERRDTGKGRMSSGRRPSWALTARTKWTLYPFLTSEFRTVGHVRLYKIDVNIRCLAPTVEVAITGERASHYRGEGHFVISVCRHECKE
jgi:hypothetical protein